MELIIFLIINLIGIALLYVLGKTLIVAIWQFLLEKKILRVQRNSSQTNKMRQNLKVVDIETKRKKNDEGKIIH